MDDPKSMSIDRQHKVGLDKLLGGGMKWEAGKKVGVDLGSYVFDQNTLNICMH